MKKSELIKKAKSVFKALKDVNELLATEDGQFFTTENKSAAIDHANRKNGAKREKALELFTIKREEAFAEEKNMQDEKNVQDEKKENKKQSK